MTSTLMVIATLLILVMALSAMILQNLTKRQSIAPLPPFEPLPAPANDRLEAQSPTLKPFDAVHWAQMNQWLFEGQTDDRRPRLGNVREQRIGSAPVHRSTSRLSHQASFKEWSKQRHD